ncbi:DUF726 domain-containing protein [Pseudomonas sp. PvP001]|uniref:DUF726 domain-containing protein n=1 Tax=Pseudomonas sp. PvP001 TaxID=3158559 RepID=UPI00339951FF
MSKFVFRDIPPVGGTVANVFIHGYSAGHDLDDRYKLVGALPKQIPGSINLFAFWDSGHISKVSGTGKIFLTRLAWTNPITGLTALAASRIHHFMTMRARAEEVGEVLLAELNDYLIRHYPYVEKINLIGHSLGGRVLVTALRKLVYSPHDNCLRVDNVLLMAAAVEVTEAEAKAFVQRIDGDVYHAYSRNDSVLRLNMGEASMGRRSVEGLRSKEMLHEPGKGFGHMDYWPNLGKVLKTTGILQCLLGVPEEQASLETWSSLVDDLKHEDFVRKDVLLYRLLIETDRRLLDALSSLLGVGAVDISPTHLAMLITDKVQLQAGSTVGSTYRGHGIRYVQVLEAVALERLPSTDVNRCVTVTELEALVVKQACNQPHVFFDYEIPEVVGFVKWYIGDGARATLDQQKFWKRVLAEGQRVYSTVFPHKLLGALLLIAYARHRLNCRFVS